MRFVRKLMSSLLKNPETVVPPILLLSSFPNRRGSRVAGFKSRVAGFKKVAGFEKVAGFQKSRVFKRLHYRNISKNKIYTL